MAFGTVEAASGYRGPGTSGAPGGAPGAAPPALLLLGGGIGWAVLMLATYLVHEAYRTHLNTPHLHTMSAIFLGGGYIGFITALPVARLLTRRRGLETRFAAHFFGLTVSTISFTAFLFAMQYRIFYSQWHDPFGTRDWIFEFIETGAVAVYQFMVLGLPHYLPVGFPALFVVSHLLAKAMR